MADVAVVAHSRKSLGGGLPELRRILALEGVTDPLWYEVKKSRRAPKYARRAAAKGADVMFVWGGDGTVQRCIDAVADTDTAVAILPAGTANLLAANLNVPHDLAEAVRVGLHGDRRRLDTGSVNGERFTVMAGAGFDARMIADADRGAKDRLGRAAYVVTGIRNLRARRVRATIRGGWQTLLPRQGLVRADRECRQDTRRSRGFPAGATGRRAPRAGGGDGQESGPVGQDVRPARPRASGAVSLRQDHAGHEVQDPVRRTDPLRTRRRRPPGQQETAHQGPSRARSRSACRPGKAEIRSPVTPERSQTRSRS